MPEGDTLALAASLINEAIRGQELVTIDGSARDVRRERTRMRGKVVVAATSVGKHLLIDFDNGWTLRTHLGMTGAWHVYAPGEHWRTTPGKARVVLTTDTKVVVCFAAPTVELGPHDRVRASIDHLGPDLLDDEIDTSEIIARARASGPTVADLLLDQRVMAGVGNVYKSETMFVERIHPDTAVAALSDDDIGALVATAARLLRANAQTHVRSTTGSRRRGGRTWVYDRARRQCRRCRDSIVTGTHGDLGRVTYWCPTCQAG